MSSIIINIVSQDTLEGSGESVSHGRVSELTGLNAVCAL